MQNVCKDIEEYNLGKKWKILIGFDDKIADMISNKKVNPIVTKLFTSDRKLLYISIVFITQSYFKVPKFMKILSKRELQQIVYNHSSDIFFKDFIEIYKKCTAEKYSF